MAKFRLSATGAGGKTVAEIVTERAGRNEALTEGIADLLLNEAFPPSAVQLWRAAIPRIESPADMADLFDIVLEKFGVQFAIAEVKDEVIPPVEERTKPTTAPISTPVGNNSAPPPPVQALPLDGSPRKILREVLRRTNAEMKHAKEYLDLAKTNYEALKARRDECLMLLKKEPPPKVKRGPRSLQTA